jgi:Rrf2 family nitric oxide-sensitive transcriptional repressor
MFTQTVEYALRAMICLASNPAPGQTVEQISRATQVPAAYLGKVLQQLVKQQLVTSRRGAGGGFSLALPPDQISLLRVVQAVDPIQRITTCPLGLEAHGVRLCPLHKRVDNALADMERAFSQSTLAEILAEPSDSIPLCNFPRGTPAPCSSPQPR